MCLGPLGVKFHREAKSKLTIWGLIPQIAESYRRSNFQQRGKVICEIDGWVRIRGHAVWGVWVLVHVLSWGAGGGAGAFLRD